MKPAPIAWIVVVTALLGSALPPAAALAATPLGQIAPADPSPCTDGNFIQLTISSGTPYVVPAGGGVITQWQSRGRMAAAGSGRLQAWRVETGVGYRLVGRSQVEAFTAGAAPLFSTQIPVASGDILGLRLNTSGGCYATGPSMSDLIALDTAPDPALGDALSFFTGQPMSRVNVAAALEPDADCDGLGDETQDASIDPTGCNPPPPPAEADGDTSPPDTVITSGPKARVKNRTASFEFSGTDARAVAGFECRIDDSAFAPCGSPFEARVKRGRHGFEVRAMDAAGNVDSTPAARSWRVKKKKKK